MICLMDCIVNGGAILPHGEMMGRLHPQFYAAPMLVF